MTKQQEATIERIRKYVVEHDCFNSSEYEIKQFNIEDTDYGAVWVLCVTGMKEDSGTPASILCRKYRHIAVGRRGGLKTYNANGSCLVGWENVMLLGCKS